MELFPAADDEQFEFIKREIDLSDYYLVIIAGRYGSLADDGASFTEKEFDYAVTQGKPILAFLVKDPKKLTVDKSEEEKKGKAKLQQFKEKAKKSRVAKFYNNPDELKSQVLQSLAYEFRVNPKRGWIPAGLSKREDLEDIRNLQNKLILLEAENAELKLQRKDATARLGQGQDAVSWQIDVTDAWAFPILAPRSSFLLTKRIFTRHGTNYCIRSIPAEVRDSILNVEPRLFLLFARKISDQALREKWVEIAVDNYSARRASI